MDIQTIMNEADTRVPNIFTAAQKVTWLNEVQNEFFDIVKIPKVHTLQVDGVLNNFNVPASVREKNIRKVMVASGHYRSMAFDNVTPAHNYYTFDETTKMLGFFPRPAAGSAVIVYDIAPTTSFVATTLTAEPEAPKEYHWLYILGLCVRIAKGMNDVGLANNYENDFKNNLAVAQQNFLR